MGIRLNYEKAKRQLYRAIEIANDEDRPTLDEWLEITREVAAGDTKTPTAFLGTALFAKATDRNVDPLSIKAEEGRPNSVSMRSLAERVMVPASRGEGGHPRFHLGARGDWPLNNQPFFRYSHLNDIDRANDMQSIRLLQRVLGQTRKWDEEEVLAALAAYIRARTAAEADFYRRRQQNVGTVSGLQELLDGISRFLCDPTPGDLPLRLQAVAGGLVKASGANVSTQRINDPSRHAPGDLHTPDHEKPRWAAEVKAVSLGQHEAHEFVERVFEYGGIDTACIIAVHPDHEPILRAELIELARARGLMVPVAESVLEMVTMFVGHPRTDPQAIRRAGKAIAQHLQDMGAQGDTLEEWTRIFPEGPDRDRE